MLNFNSVMVGSSQPKVLAEFYEKIIGKRPDWHKCGSRDVAMRSGVRTRSGWAAGFFEREFKAQVATRIDRWLNCGNGR